MHLTLFIPDLLPPAGMEAAIAVVEAWADETLLGESAALMSRPDVNAALALPPSALTGFALRARHPAASARSHCCHRRKPRRPRHPQIRSRAGR